ncbi:MAG TPA: NnrS family protein [Chloroflexota bacterium]|nr:NnrS family protein [Chloroflexota bacterium]
MAIALVLNLGATLYMASLGGSIVPDWLDRCLIIVELFGFITTMIFGVNARNLPLFVSVRPSAHAMRPMLTLLAIGTIFAAGGQVVSLGPAGAAMAVSLAGWLAILAATATYLVAIGLLRPRARNILPAGHSGWYEAYVLAAYFWLIVGLLIETGSLIAALAGSRPPADDLFLAALHAITVGFVSTMIMGMAARIVPAFGATRLYSRKLLIATWLCITAGTVLRVPSQALYTVAGGPFASLFGLSGVIQLLALVLFAINLWRTLDSSAADQASAVRRAEVVGIGISSRPGAMR